MSNAELEALRAVVADENLSLTERKAAAEHYIAELLDAVSVPAEDDADVVALVGVTPPAVDSILGDLYIRGWEYMNTKRGWRESGPTVPQARKYVHERRRTKLLESIYRNRELHGLEREAAAQRLLDSLPASSMQRRNGITAQRLIAEAS